MKVERHTKTAEEARNEPERICRCAPADTFGQTAPPPGRSAGGGQGRNQPLGNRQPESRPAYMPGGGMDGEEFKRINLTTCRRAGIVPGRTWRTMWQHRNQGNRNQRSKSFYLAVPSRGAGFQKSFMSMRVFYSAPILFLQALYRETGSSSVINSGAVFTLTVSRAPPLPSPFRRRRTEALAGDAGGKSSRPQIDRKWR